MSIKEAKIIYTRIKLKGISVVFIKKNVHSKINMKLGYLIP
jgi:hypothetical protein